MVVLGAVAATKAAGAAGGAAEAEAEVAAGHEAEDAKDL